MKNLMLWMNGNAKKRQQIICSLILVAILLFNLSPVHALNINSSAATLIELESGEVLYEKNSNAQRPMASTSKIMTYLLTMEAVDAGKTSLNTVVKISRNAANCKGSSYNLRQNDLVTVEELLASMLIISACDSTVALAEHVGGNVANFTKKMNEKASSLGLGSANFVNSHGLPLSNGNQNKISAKDLALLSKYTLENYEEHLIGMTSQKYFNGVYRDIAKKNTNRLLETTSYTDGIKTGYTRLAGHCLVSSAKNQETNKRFVAVILGGKSGKERFDDSEKMLAYALNNYKGPIDVLIGDEPIVFEGIKPMIKDDRTLLPLRKISQSLGGFIEWDQATSTITGGREDSSYQLTVNSKLATVNGEIVEIETSPLIIEGTTMVPLRFIAESMGMEVKWDGETQTVRITPIPVPEPEPVPESVPELITESESDPEPVPVPEP